MPPTMPPAMAPALDLCPLTGMGVAVFDATVLDAALFDTTVLDAALFLVELPVTEELEGPGIVPGPSSGESIDVARVRQ